MSASAPTTASAFDPHRPVPVAVDLGWAMVELYATAHRRREASDPASELPSWSGLHAAEKTAIEIDHVHACITRLEPAIKTAGLSVPDLAPLDAAFKSGTSEALRSAIWALYGEVFRCLQATDTALGAAFELGRSLAYTCRRPEDWATLTAEFQEYRLENLLGWLADLASALPPHASRGVAVSLGIWQRSIPDPNENQRINRLSDSKPEHLLAALRRQSQLWRAVLTGTKSARDMLGPGDYTSAAGRLLWRSGNFVMVFLWKTYLVIPLVFAVGGFGVEQLVTSQATQVTKLVGVVTAAAAALGITWKGIGTALGNMAAKLEQPLWHAELDAAVGVALTTLERTRRSQWFVDQPGRIAARVTPPAGPRASGGSSS